MLYLYSWVICTCTLARKCCPRLSPSISIFHRTKVDRPPFRVALTTDDVMRTCAARALALSLVSPFLDRVRFIMEGGRKGEGHGSHLYDVQSGWSKGVQNGSEKASSSSSAKSIWWMDAVDVIPASTPRCCPQPNSAGCSTV